MRVRSTRSFRPARAGSPRPRSRSSITFAPSTNGASCCSGEQARPSTRSSCRLLSVQQSGGSGALEPLVEVIRGARDFRGACSVDVARRCRPCDLTSRSAMIAAPNRALRGMRDGREDHDLPEADVKHLPECRRHSQGEKRRDRSSQLLQEPADGRAVARTAREAGAACPGRNPVEGTARPIARNYS